MRASVFGSSGLVGGKVVEMLLDDPQYESILLANRSEGRFKDPKVEEHIIDYDQLDNYPELFTSEVIFICLGTTIKKAGSKQAFQAVDLELPHQIAKLAKKGECKRILMISSMGADDSSSNFYLKTKGQAEQKVREDGPETCIFLRPALLLGSRDEFRFGEKVAQILMPLIAPLMLGSLKKYRPIQAEQVAKAMIKLSKMPQAPKIAESDQLQKLSKD